MKNIWSVIFNKAVVDGRTNSLSLFDCLEEITINFSDPQLVNQAKKNIPIQFSIVSMWADNNFNKTRSFEYLIEITDPNNKIINQLPLKATFEKSKTRLRTIVNIDGLGVTTEGEYNIVVKQKTEDKKFIVVSKIPLNIKFVLTALIPKK